MQEKMKKMQKDAEFNIWFGQVKGSCPNID